MDYEKMYGNLLVRMLKLETEMFNMRLRDCILVSQKHPLTTLKKVKVNILIQTVKEEMSNLKRSCLIRDLFEELDFLLDRN